MNGLPRAVILAAAALAGAASAAHAATFTYSFATNTGYTGTGAFSYDAATAPAVIVESGSGPTAALLSLSLAVYGPSGTLLDSGSTVVAGVSNDSYLGFEFVTSTATLTLLDNNTTSSGNDVSYYVSNFVDPANVPVTPGSTTFNLFSTTRSTSTAVFLGSAAQIVVSPVPEPTAPAVVGPAVFLLVGLVHRVRRTAAAR